MGTVPNDASAAVIGGGTMGAGIAQSLLSALPYGTVTIVERDEQSAASAIERVTKGLQRQHAKSPDADSCVRADLARLRTTTAMLDEPAPALAVEAVHEDLGLKSEILSAAATAWPGALLATNTSSLPVTEIRRACASDRVIGMHFFNPVPRSRLVEIVVPDDCPDDVVESAKSWVIALGKTSIVVRDSPGFATSRLGVAIGLEAIRMLQEDVASAADIDRAMVLGYQFPVGPLELTDRIGLDVRLAIAEHLATVLGDRFEPPALLRQKVALGELGVKSGRGFFDWADRA